MANPTTNFGWVMPTATDLVTDLPADFNVFGQGVDTSMADLLGGTTGQILSKTSNTNMDFTWITNDVGDITAVTVTSPITGGGTSGSVGIAIQDATTAQKGSVQLSDSTSTTSSVLAATPTAVKSAYDLANAAIAKSTVTTAGDIIYRDASTPARLGIGTTGQVLTVASGIPSWATASSGALTLIKARTTFTSVANTGTTFDNLFSSTYRTYLIVIDQFSSASSADAQLQLLYSGTTQNTANYYNAHQYITWNGAATVVNATGATVNNLGGMSAGANISNFTVTMYSPQASSTNWKWTWDGYSPTWQGVGVGGAFVNASQTYTGIKLFASAGNITGAVTVYGLATS